MASPVNKSTSLSTMCEQNEWQARTLPEIGRASSPSLLEENYEEQANAVEQAFDLDYDVAQAFCSYIVLKDVLLFTGEAINDGMDFEK